MNLYKQKLKKKKILKNNKIPHKIHKLMNKFIYKTIYVVHICAYNFSFVSHQLIFKRF